MSNVYFIPLTEYDEINLSLQLRRLLETVIDKEQVRLADEIPLKVHFGERGNTTYIKPGCYQGVIDYLNENDVKSRFIETNVLYRGARTTRESHIALSEEHGFTQLPITIADGHHGEDVLRVPIEGDVFDEVQLGKAFADFDQYIVFAHFKGHEQAGFGGAMKQLAMGFAARPGKMAQHASISPSVIPKKCIGCETCVDSCNYNAIDMIEDKAVIDSDLCVGCAACIAICPVGAIRNDWGAEDFLKRLGEYAYGAGKDKQNIYLNLALNITRLCDCIGEPMPFVADNFGLFASTDAVAIDRACLDMLQTREGKKMFDKGRESLDQAEKLGLGSQTYSLVTLSNN